MMRKERCLIVSAFILFLGVTQSLWAQETRGSISGRVLDTSDAVIPGVNVSVTNQGTGVKLDSISNDSGHYRINYLIIGQYEISASLPGFKTTRQLVDLRVGDQLQIDLTMAVGEVTEQVTVQAETPLLQTATADRGQVIDNERITNMALAHGNTTFLLKIAPGANPGTSTATFKFEENLYGVTSLYQFHGEPRGVNAFTINGINNSRQGTQSARLQPPPDAVQEFKISHAYDTTQGFHGGTSIDLALKSGTKDFHGAGYWFRRDDALNAGSFLDNRAGVGIPPQSYRRMGVSINGPIFKERTFFSYTLEDTRQRTLELIGTQTIPVAEQLGGDLSGLLALGPEYQIYDPATATLNADGFVQREPFANNIIPPSRLDPTAQIFAQYIPPPNLTGAADGSLNFQPVRPSPVEWKTSILRVDHSFNPKHRFFVHHSLLDNPVQEWKDYWGTLATGFGSEGRAQTFGIDDVYVVSPNLLFNVNYGYSRGFGQQWHRSHTGDFRRFKDDDTGGGFDISSVGYPQSLVQKFDLFNASMPHFFIEGYKGIHDDTRRGISSDLTHAAKAQADYTRGNTNLKAGIEFRSFLNTSANRRFIMPKYDFKSDFTRGPLHTSARAPLGQGLASYLVGQPTGGFFRQLDSRAGHSNAMGIFVYDNWRVTPRLTINAGLRWEYYTPSTERFDRSVRGFDFNAASPIEAAAQAAYAQNPIAELPLDQFSARGGLLFAGVGGQPREFYESPTGLFAPRFGMAYRFGQDTVLRGGFGIFHLPLGLSGRPAFNAIQTGYNRDTELVPSFDNGLTFAANILNPFPDGVLDPLGNSLGLATNLGQSVSFFNTDNFRAPYLQRWSLTVQHMLPNNTLLEVGYVGTRGTKLFMNRNLNAFPNQFLSTQGSRDQANHDFLREILVNPFFGLIPGTSLGDSQTTNRAQLLKPFPHFQNVTRQVNQGYSWYHGLETRIEKRFSRGHTYVVAYTWSKNMDATSYLNPGDPFPHRSIAQIDRTHIFNITSIWELPFGTGRRFGAAAPSGLRQVISGWNVSSIWYAMSGYPLRFGNDLFFNGDVKDIELPSSQRTVDRWFNTDAGFVRSGADQPVSHLRTFPLRLNSVRTEGVHFWDISVIKDTAIPQLGEEARIQFRTEFLNAFNQHNFGNVQMNPRSGSFGRVSNEMTWARQIQFGLRFIF